MTVDSALMYMGLMSIVVWILLAAGLTVWMVVKTPRWVIAQARRLAVRRARWEEHTYSRDGVAFVCVRKVARFLRREEVLDEMEVGCVSGDDPRFNARLARSKAGARVQAAMLNLYPDTPNS